MTAEEFWASWCGRSGMAGPVPAVTAFGDGRVQQDDLCALVLAGTKRATVSLALWYERDGVAKPLPGALVIALDGEGAPRALLEVTAVHEATFRAVGADFARDEGEGDGSLAYWRAEHEAFFTRELAEAGLLFSPEMIVVCERFRMLWDGR